MTSCYDIFTWSLLHLAIRVKCFIYYSGVRKALKSCRWKVFSEINKLVGHVGRKKSQKRIRNVTLLLGTSEYIKSCEHCGKTNRNSFSNRIVNTNLFQNALYILVKYPVLWSWLVGIAIIWPDFVDVRDDFSPPAKQ